MLFSTERHLLLKKSFLPLEWNFDAFVAFSLGPFCLRASAEADKTNGFFVAIFKRIKDKKNQAETEKPLITREETIDHKSRKRKVEENERNFEIFDPSNGAEIQHPQEEYELQNGVKRRKKKSNACKGLKSEEQNNTLIRTKKDHKKNSKRKKRTLKTPVTATTK